METGNRRTGNHSRYAPGTGPRIVDGDGENILPVAVPVASAVEHEDTARGSAWGD